MPTQIKWSDQQLNFFSWLRGDYGAENACVRARAGTGKTTSIFGGIKFAREIVHNEKIVILAFNSKNGREFKAKVAADPALRDNRSIETMTTHGLGHRFVRYYLGVKKLEIDDKLEAQRVSATMIAEAQKERAERTAATAKKLGIKNLPPEDDSNAPDPAPSAMVALVCQLISKLKNIIPLFPKIHDAVALAEKFSIEPDNGWVEEGWTVAKIAHFAIETMKKTSEEKPVRGAAVWTITNDDMLWLPLIMDLARPWYNLIVVDEAQDLNRAQMELVKRALKRGGRICFVGDDRQAIYRFRGAESDALDNLKTTFNCREFPLTITRRCGKAIVREAKYLVPDYQSADDAHEGEIKDISGAKVLETAAVGDFIISRKNAPLMAICLGLIRRGVPAKVEGRDIAGSLKSLINRQRGIKTAEALCNKLERWAEKQIAKIMKRDPQNETAVEYVRDQFETIKAIAEGCKTIEDVLAKIDSLFANTDDSHNPNIVTCSSVHKAKGLEAERVFVLMDTLYSKSRTADPTEEANIHYVAITRAKVTLFKVTGDVAKEAA